MMKHKWFALMAAVFLVTSVNADECNTCDPCESTCDMCDPCGEWTVELDWLYWHVRRCELIYATAGQADALKIKDIDLSYDSGFRIGAFKECGDAFFGIRYTGFCYEDSQTVIDDNVRAARISEVTISDLKIAKSRYKLDLDVLEIEASYTLLDECESSAHAFGGFRYASIDQSLSTLYGENKNDISGSGEGNDIELVSEKNNMDGYGLYLGGAGSFTFCDCFNFYGSMSIGSMIAEFDRSYLQFTIFEDNKAISDQWKDDCYKLVSNLDFAVGVGYDLCDFCCVDWSVTLGYEFHHWMNTLDFIVAEADGDEFKVDRHSEDLGFDGLFLRLTGTF